MIQNCFSKENTASESSSRKWICKDLEPELWQELKNQEQLLLLEEDVQTELQIYPKPFPVRKVWSSEAYHFSPWLERNIDFLSEALGLTLVSVESEVPLANFRVDLVGQTQGGEKFPMELQLTKGDHKHLGQLIAYLLLHKAKLAVWIATDFTNGHKQVIRELNKTEIASFRLFRIKVVQFSEWEPAKAVLEAVEFDG